MPPWFDGVARTLTTGPGKLALSVVCAVTGITVGFVVELADVAVDLVDAFAFLVAAKEALTPSKEVASMAVLTNSRKALNGRKKVALLAKYIGMQSYA